MSLQERYDEIHQKYFEFRDATYNLPKYWILSPEARQVIKTMSSPPHGPSSMGELKEYLGVPVIHLEEAIIVE